MLCFAFHYAITGTSKSFSPNTRYEAAEGFPILIVQSEHSTSTRNAARQLLGLRYVIVPLLSNIPADNRWRPQRLLKMASNRPPLWEGPGDEVVQAFTLALAWERNRFVRGKKLVRKKKNVISLTIRKKKTKNASLEIDLPKSETSVLDKAIFVESCTAQNECLTLAAINKCFQVLNKTSHVTMAT